MAADRVGERQRGGPEPAGHRITPDGMAPFARDGTIGTTTADVSSGATSGAATGVSGVGRTGAVVGLVDSTSLVRARNASAGTAETKQPVRPGLATASWADRESATAAMSTRTGYTMPVPVRRFLRMTSAHAAGTSSEITALAQPNQSG